MQESIERYRKLNPFVQNSVGENVIWGSDDNGFCNVESINENAFKTILTDIESVSAHAKTRARFLVGAAGSGKSHLFARLRRSLPNGQFTFASNPPTAIPHVKRFILKKVISSMARPAMGPEGPLPYSQLQRIVYSILQKILKPKDLNPSQIHGFWKTVSRAEYGRIQSKFIKALGAFSPLEIPIHWRRVLFRILDSERRDLAVNWLSGNQSLTDADYQNLDVTASLADDEISEVMKQLGHLSTGAGPIILILDQLDILAKPDQIHEIESLMIDLNDGSRNWYVIVSLVQEKFDLWLSTLSIPFKHRFGRVTHDSIDLDTVELSALSEQQRRQLIMARLSTPQLGFQRKNDGINDPSYPLSELDVHELTLSDICNSRLLIQKALQAYVNALSGQTKPATRPLCDFMEQLFNDFRLELREEDLAVDTASTADRIGELFGLLWFVKKDQKLESTDGPLHTEIDNFDGIDRVYNCHNTRLRVVNYDVQQTNKFPSILKKIAESSPSSILIRDGCISVSGKVTKERLDLFQRDKRFFHLSLDQIRNLHALGNLLAKMREGEFDNEETEPKPTKIRIYECLAQNPDLVQTDLTQAFMEMCGLAGKVQCTTSIGGTENIRGGLDSFQPDDPIVAGLATIMQAERWMSFERLCVRASSRGISVDPQRVYQCLKAAPLCDSVLIYPRHANLLETIGIVIWNLE